MSAYLLSHVERREECSRIVLPPKPGKVVKRPSKQVDSALPVVLSNLPNQSRSMKPPKINFTISAKAAEENFKTLVD